MLIRRFEDVPNRELALVTMLAGVLAVIWLAGALVVATIRQAVRVVMAPFR